MDYFSRLSRSDRKLSIQLDRPTQSQYLEVQHGGKHLSVQLFRIVNSEFITRYSYICVHLQQLVYASQAKCVFWLFKNVSFLREFQMFILSFGSGVWTEQASSASVARLPKPVLLARWSGDVMKRPGHKNFNAVSHNRSQPEVLFLNLTWRSRGQISSVLLQLLLFAFSNMKFGRHGKWSVTFW